MCHEPQHPCGLCGLHRSRRSISPTSRRQVSPVPEPIGTATFSRIASHSSRLCWASAFVRSNVAWTRVTRASFAFLHCYDPLEKAGNDARHRRLNGHERQDCRRQCIADCWIDLVGNFQARQLVEWDGLEVVRPCQRVLEHENVALQVRVLADQAQPRLDGEKHVTL